MRKRVLLLSAVIALCAFFFACRPFQKQVVTLELGVFAGSNWDVANGNSYHTIELAVSQFENDHPGVKVHYYSGIRRQDYSEWLAGQILSGRTPDVFLVPDGQFNILVSQGVLKNLEQFLQKEKQIKSWEYFAPAWNAGSSKGNQYALPYQTDCMLMAVNCTLLKRHNLQMPERDWTWDDFFSLCRGLGPDVAGTCNYTWQEAVYANGIKLFDDNGTQSNFSDFRTVEAVQFMQRLTVLTEGRSFTSADFDAGRVACMPMSFARFCTYVSYPYKVYKDVNFEWGCLPMPAGYSGNNISEVKTLLAGMNTHSKHPYLSFELLKTLTHDTAVQTDVYSMGQGASPLRIIAASGASRNVIDAYTRGGREYNLGLLADILDKGMAVPRFSKYGEAMGVADSSISRIITEKKDADISLKLLQRTIQEQLAK